MLSSIPPYLKRTILAVSILMVCKTGHSQNAEHAKSKLSVGVFGETVWPLAEFRENHKRGTGGSATLRVHLEPQTVLQLSAGYLHFPGKTFEDQYLKYAIHDWQAIPVRLGGNYFVTSHFFLRAEAGAVFFVEPGGGTSLILGPGIGLRLQRVEAAAKIETWTGGGTVSFAGFGLGYTF